MATRSFLFSALIVLIGVAVVVAIPANGHHLQTSTRHSSQPRHVKLTKIPPRDDATNQPMHNSLIRPTNFRTQYAVEVQFNGIPRYLILDTGSSDTWMVTEDTKCLNQKDKVIDKSKCGFGDPYTGTFDPIPNVHYYEQYGSVSNSFRTYGRFGHVDVTVSGITVKNQQVALVDGAVFSGNNLLSGLFGLASRKSTSQYPGNNQTDNPIDKLTNYSPVFESMYKRTKQIEPMFSLALQRGRNGGYLAFDSLPPVDFDHDFASTKLLGFPGKGKPTKDLLYPIQPQGYQLGEQYHETSYISIVDSGTYTNLLPKEMADKVGAAFYPPAKYKAGYYSVQCNATAPDFGIKIGGKTFSISPEDMILKIGDLCFSSIAEGVPPGGLYPKGFYILGDAFLHNVVAVFDVGHEEMRFAPHTSY